MPFHPLPGRPEDYPERDNPRQPWDEWGPQEQERNLREALGMERGAWGREGVQAERV